MAVELKFAKFDNTPWGFRLAGGSDYGVPLTVIRVYEGGPSETIGLKEGDQLYQLNGECMMQVTHDAAHEIITRAGNNFQLSVLRGQNPQYALQQVEQADPFGQPMPDTEPATFQSTRELHPLCQSQAAQVSSIIENRFTNNLTPKMYRPFSKKIPSDIPPLENPLILSPNHLDEFQTIKQHEWKEMSSKLDVQKSSSVNRVQERSQSSCSTNSQKKVVEEELIVTGKILIDLNEIENSVKDTVEEKTIQAATVEEEKEPVCQNLVSNVLKKESEVINKKLVEGVVKKNVNTVKTTVEDDKISESSVLEEASASVKETISKFSKSVQDKKENIVRSTVNKVKNDDEIKCDSRNHGITLEDAKSSAQHAASVLSQHVKHGSLKVPCAIANIKTEKETDMLLKTFFVHLTDVMVALTHMIQNDEGVKCCACNCLSNCMCVKEVDKSSVEKRKNVSTVEERATDEISSVTSQHTSGVTSSVRKTVEKPPDEREIVVNGSVETGRIMKEVIQNTMGVNVTVEGKDPLEWLADLDGRKTPSYYISKVTCVQTGVVDDEVQDVAVEVEKTLKTEEDTSIVGVGEIVKNSVVECVVEKAAETDEREEKIEEICSVEQKKSKEMKKIVEINSFEQEKLGKTESVKGNISEEVEIFESEQSEKDCTIEKEKVQEIKICANSATNAVAQHESVIISENCIAEVKSETSESASSVSKTVSKNFESIQASQVFVEEKKGSCASVIEQSAALNVKSFSSKQNQIQICETQFGAKEEMHIAETKRDVKPAGMQEIIQQAVVGKEKNIEEQPKDPSTPNTDEYLFRLDIKLPDKIKREYVKQPSLHEDLSIVRRPGFVLGEVNIEESSTKFEEGSKNNEIIKDPLDVVSKTEDVTLIKGIKEDGTVLSSTKETFGTSIALKNDLDSVEEAAVLIPKPNAIIKSVVENGSQKSSLESGEKSKVSASKRADAYSSERVDKSSSIRSEDVKISEKKMDVSSIESTDNSACMAMKKEQISKEVDMKVEEEFVDVKKEEEIVEKSSNFTASASKKRVAFSQSCDQKFESDVFQSSLESLKASSNAESTSDVHQTEVLSSVKLEEASSSVSVNVSTLHDSCSANTASKTVALSQHEEQSLDIANPHSDLHDKEPKENDEPKQNGMSNGTCHISEVNGQLEESQVDSCKVTVETSHMEAVEETKAEESTTVMTMGAAQKNFATIEAPKITTVNGGGVNGNSDEDILGKPGITDQEIAEIISGEAEVLKEQHVLGVDFGKMMPTCEYLKRSEVFKMLNDEAIKTAAERMQEQRKWTKFLQRPDRPVPFCKKHVDQLANEEPPYRVNIKKQPKKEQDLLGHSILTEGVFLIPEVPILIPEPAPQYFEAPEYLADSDFPDLEDTGIPIPDPVEDQGVPETEYNLEEQETQCGEIIEENKEELKKSAEEEEKVAEDSKEWSDPMLVDDEIDEDLPVSEQLLKVQKQLTALSKLPAAIQQTLDLVTRQLGKMVPGSVCAAPVAAEKEQNEVTQNGDEVKQNGDEVNQSGDEVKQNGDTEVVQNGDVSVNAGETVINNDAPSSEHAEEMQENKVNCSDNADDEKPEAVQDSKETVVEEDKEQIAKKNIEERNIEKMKKDLVAELSKDQAIRKRGPKPAFGPLTPQQRAVVLPGGRRWRKPKDAYDDAFIAETLSAQASIITGTTLGKFESDHLPYDQRESNCHLVVGNECIRVNFMKYDKPPKTLDHLKNSSVFKLVHEMDAPFHGIEDRNGGALLAESEYRERCRSVTPCSLENQNGNGVPIEADS